MGLIFHSDRGSEYSAAAFRDRLTHLGVRQSSAVTGPGENAHMEFSFRYEYFFVHADGEQLREIARLVESGAITPLVDKVFRLEEVRDALAYSESGRATGKVVIKVV